MATTDGSGPVRPAVIGSYGPAQIACLRSWKRLGLTPLFIHIGERPLPLAGWVAAAVLHLPEPLVETAEGAARVAAFLRQQGASGITCLSESLARWLNALAAEGTLPVSPWVCRADALERLTSKATQVRVARSAGLPVLPSVLVDHASVEAVTDDLFPLVLRPDDAGTVQPGFKAQLLPDRAALTAFVASRRRIDRPLVGQRLIVGPNLVVHGARSPQGEVFALAAFRADRKFEGVTLRLSRTYLEPGLAAACTRFAEAIGVTGCFHFEFIEDADGCPWFLEMNGRLGGTTGKVFALDYDEPRHLVGAFVPSLRQRDPIPTRRGHATAKQALVRATLQRLRGADDPLDYPGLTRGQAVAEAAAGLLTWREEIWRPGWPATSLVYLLDRMAPLGKGRPPEPRAAAGEPTP